MAPRGARTIAHLRSWHWPNSHITHFWQTFHLAGTPYAGGQFRVQLTLPKDFPANPPKAYFLTKIFHPNVASNGEICVNTLKKDWKSDLGIKHILLVSRKLQESNGSAQFQLFSLLDNKMFADCAERWVSAERGGGKASVRALRRLLPARQAHDRHSRSSQRLQQNRTFRRRGLQLE